jgi:YHS domain-containing protein
VGHLVIDPVCLKQLDETTAPDKAEFRGQTYYFDNDRCRRVFERSPAEFAGKIAQIVYGDQRRFRPRPRRAVEHLF